MFSVSQVEIPSHPSMLHMFHQKRAVLLKKVVVITWHGKSNTCKGNKRVTCALVALLVTTKKSETLTTC